MKNDTSFHHERGRINLQKDVRRLGKTYRTLKNSRSMLSFGRRGQQDTVPGLGRGYGRESQRKPCRGSRGRIAANAGSEGLQRAQTTKDAMSRKKARDDELKGHGTILKT